MFNCIGLSKKNIDIMKEFNNKRIEFNQLNDDFFDEYNSCNYAQQIFLIKKVKLLLYDSNYIGYLWLGSKNRNNTVIKSINVDTGFDLPTTFKILINSVNNKTDFTYMCLDNGTNFYILEKVGFVKDKGTLEMAKDITDIKELFYDENIDFQVFKRGVHEKLRCELQNEIFKNSSRVPLSIEDIYYDELQSYYYSQGSIFIKYKHK